MMSILNDTTNGIKWLKHYSMYLKIMSLIIIDILFIKLVVSYFLGYYTGIDFCLSPKKLSLFNMIPHPTKNLKKKKICVILISTISIKVITLNFSSIFFISSA